MDQMEINRIWYKSSMGFICTTLIVTILFRIRKDQIEYYLLGQIHVQHIVATLRVSVHPYFSEHINGRERENEWKTRRKYSSLLQLRNNVSAKRLIHNFANGDYAKEKKTFRHLSKQRESSELWLSLIN